VVVDVTREDAGNITDAALPVSIILAGAHLPNPAIIDVDFPRWMLVA